MVSKEFLLVFANSQKNRERCVAGKLLFPFQNGICDVGPWVRPVHPETGQGAIPEEMTVIDQQPLVPLDVIEIGLSKRANDPDHPEDWQIDPRIPWQRAATVPKNCVAQLQDDPLGLWGEASAHSRRVPVGYVPAMDTPATLRLVTSALPSTVQGFMEDRMDGRGPRLRVRLEIQHNGIGHFFDVKDVDFIKRYGIKEHVWQHEDFQMRFTNPNKVAFCLSLTPPYNGFQYKIAAAIIEL